jgi:hypothetical protein
MRSCPGRRFRGTKRRECLRIVIEASSFNASFFAKRTRILICLQFSTSFGGENHMNWIYWDTAWSLFFSLVWFMTITNNPDARIADAHLRDEAFGG